MEKFDLKGKCHCLSCEWEGTYEDLECTQLNRGEPQCPNCSSDDIENGWHIADINSKEDSLGIAEAIQYNLKNLAWVSKDPAYSTIYMVLCGQVDALVGLLEGEYDEEENDKRANWN